MAVGLVLEGGAMRGMYTAGVLDHFLDEGILVDRAVGVSAGALFGMNYISRQKGRVIRYNKKYNSDKNYMGLRPLLREGNIVSTQYAYHDVPRILDPFDDEAYKTSPIPFYAVVTNLSTGKAEYIHVKSVFEQMHTMRASGSMPFVSRPVEIDGGLYLDGAVADSIPFEWMSDTGCEKLIVVLTRDATYRKKPMSKFRVQRKYRKYPNFAKALLRRHEVYNDSLDLLEEWEKEGRAFVIRPSAPIEIARIEKDPEKLQAVYDLGVRDVTARMAELKEYLKQ